MVMTMIPNAHGTAVTDHDSTLYVTSQTGSTIYKIHLDDWSSDPVNLGAGASGPHEIIFSPDGSKYYVSCQYSNEVRVYNAANDQFILSIPVGSWPQEFSISQGSSFDVCYMSGDSQVQDVLQQKKVLYIVLITLQILL
jgi:YVTN family beta-propeller protein